MEIISIFVSTFIIVFIGELGDKTQIATGTGTLANPSRISIRIIFLSSSLALITMAGITTFFAGLIPEKYIPNLIKTGGFLLIVYGTYLYLIVNKNQEDTEENLLEKNSWLLFFSHFWVVFIAETGDKTQVFTLSAALENQVYIWVVFTASSFALVSVTALTIFGITKLPKRWVNKIQKLGAVLMILYGIYMIF